MLKNYEKYQQIWTRNMKLNQVARDKLNEKGLNMNYKVNKQ